MAYRQDSCPDGRRREWTQLRLPNCGGHNPQPRGDRMGWKLKPHSLVHTEINGVREVICEVVDWNDDRKVYTVRPVGGTELYERGRTNVQRVKFEDKNLVCTDCGEPFTFKIAEQVFYVTHKLQETKRCKECRADRRDEQPSEI